MDSPQHPVSPISLEDRVVAAVAYFWLLSIVVLFLKRDNPFVAFHAKQGFVLLLISIIAWFIPIFGILANMLLFLVILIGFAQALSGATWKIPVVSGFAEKINL